MSRRRAKNERQNGNVEKPSGPMTKRSLMVIGGGLLLLLLLIAGLFWGQLNAQESVSQEVAAKPVASVSDGPLASDFSLPTLDGGTFTLSEHKGEVVVLYFMASWCGSCVPEARSLATLYEQYKAQGLTVVAINLEPQANKAELSKFRELADNAAYTWAFDTTFAVAQAYSVQTLDATVIIDSSGRIAYQDAMPTPLATLEAELQKWLPAAGGLNDKT